MECEDSGVDMCSRNTEIKYSPNLSCCSAKSRNHKVREEEDNSIYFLNPTTTYPLILVIVHVEVHREEIFESVAQRMLAHDGVPDSIQY